jgi:folate-dependent phosphoribosylglycinamide formyltransferase PurN
VLVTREPHCLYDLLGRVVGGELPVRIAAVIGNHEELRSIVEAHGVPFHHMPIPPPGDAAVATARAAAFVRLRDLVDSHDPDAIVLARFMQILPPDLCAAWFPRAINIHHSFLPSFAGARPYHQAHARGVKLIGATCHYVTAELDSGPIIEQDVIQSTTATRSPTWSAAAGTSSAWSSPAPCVGTSRTGYWYTATRPWSSAEKTCPAPACRTPPIQRSAASAVTRTEPGRPTLRSTRPLQRAPEHSRLSHGQPPPGQTPTRSPASPPSSLHHRTHPQMPRCE